MPTEDTVKLGDKKNEETNKLWSRKHIIESQILSTRNNEITSWWYDQIY